MSTLDHQTLLDHMDYSPTSGELIWLKPTTRRVKVGDSVGSLHSKGYLHTSFLGQKYFCHILVWFYVYGIWPTSKLDHEDGDRTNNRISNLRLATTTQNAQNAKAHRDNLCGFKGVRKCRAKYAARIRVNGESIHLGSFPTAEEAAKAYDSAAVTHFGAFAQTNKAMGLIP